MELREGGRSTGLYYGALEEYLQRNSRTTIRLMANTRRGKHMSEIDVRIRPINGKGNLIASATVFISTDKGDIKIERVKVVKDKEGKPFIALPQQQYSKNGTTQYMEIIELPYKIMREIEATIFKDLGL